MRALWLRMGKPKTDDADAGVAGLSLEAKIGQFFQETHVEGGKTVQAQELVTMRSETIGGLSRDTR